MIAYYSVRQGRYLPLEPRANLATTACARTAKKFCDAQRYALVLLDVCERVVGVDSWQGFTRRILMGRGKVSKVWG